jgi:hypothetical protein
MTGTSTDRGDKGASANAPTAYERRSKMRVPRLLAWLAGLTLSAALLAPVTASATETQTVHFSGTDSRAEVNPCSGVPGTLKIVFSGVIHTADLANGSTHITSTITGTVTFVPNDASEASFAGHMAQSNVNNGNIRNATITNAENVILHGSDGSLGRQHILFHLTVNAGGTATSSLDVDEFSC